MKNSSVTTETTESISRIQELELENEGLRAKIAWLENQFRLAKHKQFGASSEKTPNGQLELPLFNEAEVLAVSLCSDKEDSKEETSKKKTSRKPRVTFNESLPVKIVTYQLPEEEQICSCCGNDVHVIKTETHREIEIIPAQVNVIEHQREVYGCRTCEREGIETPITKAQVPNSPLPKGMATPSALSFVINQKYGAGMPLYRLEDQLKQLGVTLSRQTLSNWIMNTTERWITPMFELMKKTLVNQSVLHADETTVQVLREDGREATSKSYIWLYRTGQFGPPCVLFDYKTTRAAKHPKNFLSGFSGKLHVDGYVGYESLSNVRLSGCWAHARRSFVDAQKSAPTSTEDKFTLTDEAIERIGALYGIESEMKTLKEELGERYAEYRTKTRQERSLPLVEDFFAWLKLIRPQVLPKSPFGRAISYLLNHQKKLLEPFYDGKLDLDNNLAERSIKPFVIGRKNWLFSNTPRGAESSAKAYSLIVTAKENGLNLYAYLTYIFTELPNIDLNDQEQLEKYLPWSKVLPEHCYLVE